MTDVTLVIPGRNCSNTIKQCLESVAPLLDNQQLKEIIFVNDGSTDDTESIVGKYPVTILQEQGRGPGAARNRGINEAKTELIWFIDSDCVANPDALEILKRSLDDQDVAGAGGSYNNMNPDSVLSCLIHEEIIIRHLRMPEYVDFLASFNILFRKQILDKLGSFNEKLRTAQDAELSYRMHEAGYLMRFDIESRVAHFHPTNFISYLRTQYRHGYWRIWVYLTHPKRASGDSYSSLRDLTQPILSGISIATIPFIFFSPEAAVLFILLNILNLIAALPEAIDIYKKNRSGIYLLYLPMTLIRSYARASGMIWGLLTAVSSLLKNKFTRPTNNNA